MELETFSQRLKRLRKIARLTQEELAEKIKVSIMTVRRMEEIQKLCEVLH